MDQKILIAALEKLVLSQSSTKTWRSVNDVFIKDTDPHWKGDGVLGPGTYHRPEPQLDYAWSWQNVGDDEVNEDLAREWYIITEYQIRFKKLATLDKTNTEELWSNNFVGLENNPLFKGKIQNEDISTIAKKKRYDGVLVQGDEDEVDGGNQFLIPSGSKPPFKTIKHHIVFQDEHTAGQVASSIKTKVKKITNGYLVNVSTSQESAVDASLAHFET